MTPTTTPPAPRGARPQAAERRGAEPGCPPEDRCLRFVRAMPGLDGLLHFRLDPLDPDAGDAALFTLTSNDRPEVSLLVAAPWVFFPDYTPEVEPDDAEALELASAEDALLFVVLTPGATAADSTANLLAPIVVNRHSMRATQVLLTGTDLPLRARLAP